MRAVADVRTDGRALTLLPAAPRSLSAIGSVARWWLRNWLNFAEVVGAQWR